MRRVMAVLALCAGTVLSGCAGKDAAGPAEGSLAGTWNMQTLNGAALPVTVQLTGLMKVELMGDVITAAPTGTFTQFTTTRVTVTGQSPMTQPMSNSGSYTVSGTTVTFTFADGTTGTATLSGSTMSATMQGFTAVYQKQ